MYLTILEHHAVRVLTTAQLALAFQTSAKVISNNFTRNKAHYTHGKHYFVLTDEELRIFKTVHQKDDQFKHSRMVYLWTEKGAWLHAKSLGTNKAWAAYLGLVDDYYNKQASVQTLDSNSTLINLLRVAKTLVEYHKHLMEQMDIVQSILTEQVKVDRYEQRVLQRSLSNRVFKLTTDARQRRYLFTQLHREIKERWCIASYKDLKQSELANVLTYVDAWRPRVVVV